MNNQILPRESKNALAVIMISGAVDLEHRMLTDNHWTLSLLERDLNFIKDQCAYYNGQVLESTQFSLVAKFKDVAEAVKCALDTQKTLTTAAATMQPRDVLGHSIGIHIGDLVTTGTEFSGNGKTIANQLQLDANWGTIHISESIYTQMVLELDLTKNCTANYVGDRYLQKIYQLIPQGFVSSIPVIKAPDIDRIEIIEESVEPNHEYVEPSKILFDQVVNDLEVSQNIIEIKQLLLYICLNKWESDRLKLGKLNLKGLIQELLELAATPKQLKSLVVEIIQTVEGEYTLIAEIIINEISKLYIQEPAAPQDIFDEVIQSLEDDSKDKLRIRRLLFYLCKYDLGNLDPKGLTLKVAVKELQNLYPSLEALRNRMKQALSLINKPEYTAIMDVVIDELSAIYPTRSLAQAQIVTIASDLDLPNYNFGTAVAAVPIPVNKEFNPQKLEHKSAESLDQEIAELDLFDLRLELIKYLSPLRVKILIFSTLNNVAESTNESISAIRTFELDDLLRDLFYAYKSPEKLETQLKITAKQFKDIDEYEQAATVIMNAVMTIYTKLKS